ncbi:MAG: septum formation initiator family protein [Actinobacteria bacterium]|nr:septum formation initiator family protein [Actinomycetota bacterium]
MAKRAPKDDVRRAAAPKKQPKRKLRRQRTSILLRWCMVGVFGLVGFLYYHPLATYFETRGALSARTAEVETLRAQKARLEARLEHSATLEALAQEARRMNLVRPGERLYIVKGIPEWRAAQRTLRGDG